MWPPPACATTRRDRPGRYRSPASLQSPGARRPVDCTEAGPSKATPCASLRSARCPRSIGGLGAGDGTPAAVRGRRECVLQQPDRDQSCPRWYGCRRRTLTQQLMASLVAKPELGAGRREQFVALRGDWWDRALPIAVLRIDALGLSHMIGLSHTISGDRGLPVWGRWDMLTMLARYSRDR